VVVRIFSSLAASPTRPRRFTSTVVTPPPVSSSESPPFSLSERFIVVWAGRRAGRCRRRHLLSDRRRLHRFPTLLVEVCSLQQTPPRQSPVCIGIGLGRGVCARTAASWAINYDADGKITNTSSLLVIFSY
jgi:hypothetical protein